MERILTSWKEIAVYLGKGVRTVQRWETELELPVRRPHRRDRQIVLAFTDELDQWAKRSRSKSKVSLAAEVLHARELIAGLVEQITRLTDINKRLAATVERNRLLNPAISPQARAGFVDSIVVDGNVRIDDKAQQM